MIKFDSIFLHSFTANVCPAFFSSAQTSSSMIAWQKGKIIFPLLVFGLVCLCFFHFPVLYSHHSLFQFTNNGFNGTMFWPHEVEQLLVAFFSRYFVFHSLPLTIRFSKWIFLTFRLLVFSYIFFTRLRPSPSPSFIFSWI